MENKPEHLTLTGHEHHLASDSTKSMIDYVQHCKTNYLSTFNDGYTRDYYRGELLRLKAVLNQTLTDTRNTLNGKNN